MEEIYAEMLIEMLREDGVLTEEETGVAIGNLWVYYSSIEHKRREL